MTMDDAESDDKMLNIAEKMTTLWRFLEPLIWFSECPLQAKVIQRPNVSAKWRKFIPVPCILQWVTKGKHTHTHTCTHTTEDLLSFITILSMGGFLFITTWLRGGQWQSLSRLNDSPHSRLKVKVLLYQSTASESTAVEQGNTVQGNKKRAFCNTQESVWILHFSHW